MEKILYKNFYTYFLERSLLSDLYKNSLLTPITIGCLISVVAVGTLFYYNPLPFRTWFYKKRHWVISMLANGLIWFLMAYMTCVQVANGNLPRSPSSASSTYFCDQGFGAFAWFGFQMFGISCLFFFLLSLGLKLRSINARKTPF
jgi:hypothetical protein